MGYYRLVKDGPTIDNILKCFNTWDFSTYPTIEEYVDTKIAGTVWGNITGTLADQTDLQTALNSKANGADVVHLTGAETITGIKTFVNTINIKQSQSNSVALQCLSSNKLQIGSSAGAPSTLRLGDANGGGSHRGQVEINADGEITCKEDDYGVTAYLKLPAQGTSSQRATLATTDDISTAVSGKADDSGVVHLAGAEEITGNKTFKDCETIIETSTPTAPSLKFKGSASGYGGSTIIEMGQTSGNNYVLTLPVASGTLALQNEIPTNIVNTFAGETGDITINTNYFELSAQKELQFKAHLYQHFIYLYNSSDKTNICFGLVSLHPVALSLAEMIVYVRAMLIETNAKISATGTIKIGTVDHKYVGAIGKGSNDGELLVYPMISTGGYDTGQVITASSNLTMIDNCVAIL